jgi:hypothetical protein
MIFSAFSGSILCFLSSTLCDDLFFVDEEVGLFSLSLRDDLLGVESKRFFLEGVMLRVALNALLEVDNGVFGVASVVGFYIKLDH